jgi:hypothetical protein
MTAMARRKGILWEGVALRRTRAGTDPDAPPRPIALPATWDRGGGLTGAAAALAALVPGSDPVSLPRAAEAWIGGAIARGLRAGVLDGAEAPRLAHALRALLLTRRGAPGAEVWRGDAGAEPRFVLSLPGFLEPEGGFDAEGFAEACAIGVRVLESLGGGKATRLRLGFADLAGALAGLGLAYASAEARAAAACIAAAARGAAEAESGRLAARLGAREPAALLWPAPPTETLVPGLAAAARAALDSAAAVPGLRHRALLALAPPDAVEALLGAETGGIAPAAGPTRAALDGAGRPPVEMPTRAALRVAVAGGPDRVARLLAPATETARAAMRDAVQPFLHTAVPPAPALPAAARRPLPLRPPAPRRQAEGALRVLIGGNRVALHRTMNAEGRLTGLAFTLAREGAAFRGLLDGFAASVSLGLAQGVPLSSYVDAFAYSRLGPAGPVEGDPDIRRASSIPDWAFRRLAADHLGRRDLPDPTEADAADPAIGGAAAGLSGVGGAPLLPLDLPRQPSPGGRGEAPERPLVAAPGGAAPRAGRGRRPMRLAG